MDLSAQEEGITWKTFGRICFWVPHFFSWTRVAFLLSGRCWSIITEHGQLCHGRQDTTVCLY